MIIAFVLVYVAILALLVKLGVIRWTLWWKLSPVLLVVLEVIFLAVPMMMGSPSGQFLVQRHSVQIAPVVMGRISHVAFTEAPATVTKGDLLFEMDATPYRAAVANLEAQLDLATLRLGQKRRLARTGAGSEFDVEQFAAQVESLGAQLERARWELEGTRTLAPADGRIADVNLRPGAILAAGTQVMAFIDTEQEALLFTAIPQIFVRHIKPGDEVEVILKLYPGRVFDGTVAAADIDSGLGMFEPTGIAPVATTIPRTDLVVRLAMGEDLAALDLPAGAMGTAAIYTDAFSFARMIRRVKLRTDGWLNFVLP